MAEKKRIGTMPCEGKRCTSHAHKVPVVVFENEKGTLSYGCDYCGRAIYARPGSDMHADWMADIKLFAAVVKPSEPAPAPAEKKPAATAATAPAEPESKEKSKATIFG